MEMVKFLGMALVYCSGLTCIKEGWQYNSLVDFQLSTKSDSISFPDICAKSAECYAGLRSSGCNLIIILGKPQGKTFFCYFCSHALSQSRIVTHSLVCSLVVYFLCLK